MLFLLLALVLCWLTTLSLRRACDRRSSRFDFAGVVILFLCCWPPPAWLLVASLERSFPVSRYPAGDAEWMLVLASNNYPSNAAQPETEPGFGTYLRCAHAAWLFHHWRRLQILVSGGFIGGPASP